MNVRLAELDVCDLTTIGRKSGRERTVEIWFGMKDSTVYLLSGGGGAAQWVQNLVANPEVRVALGRRRYVGTARLVESADEDRQARELLAAKYQGWRPGKRLSAWARDSLPVAIDLAG